MMEKLNNAARAEILRTLANNKAEIRYGLVTGYDPNAAGSGACTINIQPEGVVTGWLPILRQKVTGGFGLYFGPEIGDQALIAHVEGDRNVGIILGFLNSDADPMPAVPAGETWLLHKSGSFLKFTNDGNVSITTNKNLIASVGGDLTAEVQGDSNVTIHGDTTVTCDGSLVVDCDDINLGGTGGKAVALNNDTVTGGHVVASSTKVKAL